MLVTQKNHIPITEYLQQLKPYLQAGVTCVQLREKHLSKNEILVFAHALKTFLLPYRIPLIINDDMYLAKKINVDGVHLGQGDGCVLEARKLLGSKKIIGLTTDSLGQIEQANVLPINYIGVGAIFPTENKSNIRKLWGMDGLQQAIKLSKHPVIAIGGINSQNISLVLQTSVCGIAAISLFSEDPKHIKNIIKEYWHES